MTAEQEGSPQPTSGGMVTRSKGTKMDALLDRIKAYKVQEIAARQSARSLADVEAAAKRAPRTRPFHRRLVEAYRGGYGLIGEIKRATPSSGTLRESFDPAALASAYAEGGAACLSVVTDTPSFRGHDSDVTKARAACELPVLRKELILEPYQVAESRALHGDCILIIMAAVTDAQAAELEASARDWGMDVIVQVRDMADLERAALLNAALVSINIRDPDTRALSIGRTADLARRVPADRVIVAEGGLKSKEDLVELARYGIRSFIVGESLLLQEDVARATRSLLANPYKPTT